MGVRLCVRWALVARVFCVALFAACGVARAQCGLDDHGWLGGAITRVYGNSSAYAIVNMGPRLARLNTTNTSAITIDWQTNPLRSNYYDQGIEGRLHDIAVGSGYVYATVADDLHVFNLATGVPVAVHPNMGSAVFAFGTTLYIADFYTFRILNMTDPVHPVEIGRVSTASPASSGTPTSIAVSGNRAYVASGDFLNESAVVAIDLTNPASPQRLGTHLATNSTGFSPTVNIALNLVLFTPGNNELQVVDFANPALPVVRSTITSTSRIAHTRVSGNLFWIAAGQEGVKTYNLTAAGATSLRGSYNTPGFAERLGGSQPFFVADREGGLQLLNITSGASPTFVGSFASSPSVIRDFDTQGVYTYVLDNNALRIHSHLFDPVIAPLVRGSYAGVANPQRFRVAGERGALFAYLADGAAGLKIVEVSDADAPVLRGSLPLTGTCTHVAINSLFSTAYASTSTNGMRIIDVSNRALPVLRSTVTLSPPAGFYGSAWSNNRLFACTSRGLAVINVTNPAAPIVDRTIDDPDGFSECVLAGNLLYCGKRSYPGGFVIYDISNPANPTVVRVFDISINGVVDMEVANNLLYITAYSGVYIFDVSNPAQPVHVSGMDSPWPEDYDDARNMLLVDIAGGNVCYAQSERGIQFNGIPTGWAPTSRDFFRSERRCLRDDISFSTNLSANPATGITYQWLKNDVPIPGATGPTYSISNLHGVNSGLYACVATNACGSREGSWVRLTVCSADLDDGQGRGICDGGVTVEDLLYFLIIFEEGDPFADLDDGSGAGAPDGGVTIDDLLYFLVRFNAGC